MIRKLFIGAVAVLGLTTLAYAGPKEDVQSAAKKLGDAPNYSWTSTTESAFGTSAAQGKAQKDGPVWLSFTFGDNTTEAVKSGEKGAVKTADGWRSLAELAADGEQQGPGRFMGRMIQNFKTPAAQAEEIAGKVKEIQKSGDAWTGELTEDGAKDLLSFGGRRAGAEGPEIKGAKGSVKFFAKDGVLSKVQYDVSGSMNFNNEDRDVSRKATLEIKDVGSTKVELPAEVSAKLK